MADKASCRVLILSVGRRTYLVDYFVSAFGSDCVVVADADGDAVALRFASHRRTVPAYNEVSYPDSVIDIVNEFEVSMVLSLHDGEVERLATMRHRLPYGCHVWGMPDVTPWLGIDKLRTARWMASVGIAGPETGLATPQTLSQLESGRIRLPVVVKPRFGSASVGVRTLSTSAEVREWIAVEAATSEAFVIQSRVAGYEYGVDIVNGLEGEWLGVLARKKLRMRGGETDLAISVASSNFVPMAKKISAAARHVGLIDLDIIESPSTGFQVIDLNPRFGGGYPFSHLAGANVPAAFASILMGKELEASTGHLEYQCGVKSGKHVGIARL